MVVVRISSLTGIVCLTPYGSYHIWACSWLWYVLGIELKCWDVEKCNSGWMRTIHSLMILFPGEETFLSSRNLRKFENFPILSCNTIAIMEKSCITWIFVYLHKFNFVVKLTKVILWTKKIILSKLTETPNYWMHKTRMVI